MNTENDMAPAEEVSISDLSELLDDPDELNSDEASADDDLADESDGPDEGEPEEDEGEESDGEKLVIDGEEFVVPKELAPLAEKLKGLENSLRADHTRKTQEAAEMRRSAESLKQRVEQDAAFYQQNTDLMVQGQTVNAQLKEYDAVDWPALAEQDIGAYSKHKEIRDSLRAQLQQIGQEFGNRQAFMTEQQDAQQKQHYAETVETVKRAIPDYFEKYDVRVVSAAETLAAKYGIALDKAQLKRMSSDPLIVLGLVELSKYQDLIAKRPEVNKRIHEAPKMAKVISASPKPRNQEALKRLKDRGRVEDLAQFL